MPIRNFTDASGAAWTAWEVHPGAATRGEHVRSGFREGWLCFQRDEATPRLRLAPIPPDWHTASEERLRLMLRVAQESDGPPPEMEEGLRPA